MIKDTVTWQADGGAIYRLKETGRVIKVPDEENLQEQLPGTPGINQFPHHYEPELVNDYYVRVQMHNNSTDTGAAIAYKEKRMAEYIAKLLNDNPPDF